MSSSASHTSEQENPSAEIADWRKKVDDLQKDLASKASDILTILGSRNRQSVLALIEEGPVLMEKIRDLERIQQRRLDRIDRGDELEELHRKLEEGKNVLQQQDEKKRDPGNVMTSLIHQRLDAQDRLNAEIEASANMNGLLVKKTSASMKGQLRELDSQDAALITSNDTLNQHLQTLAERQEAESTREEANRKRAPKTNRRLDTLADYRAYKDREVAEAISKHDGLKLENDNLNSQIREISTKLTNAEASQHDSTEEVTNLKSNVARLEVTIETQFTRLASLSKLEAHVAEVNSGLVHLGGVILPAKEAEITSLKAGRKAEEERAGASQKEAADRIGKVNAKVLEMERKMREKNTQLIQLGQDYTSLQAAANQSTSEAESTRIELADAQAIIESLNMAQENNRLLVSKNSELKIAVANCTSQHFDIHQVRQQVLNLQKLNAELKPCKIQFDRAESLQRSSISRIKELEQDISSKDETLDEIRGRYQSIEDERDRLHEECNTLFADNIRLVTERDRLEEEIADISSHRDDLLHTAGESKAEIELITAQLQSCHCEVERPHGCATLNAWYGGWANGPSVEGSGSTARGQEVTTELKSGAQSQGTEDPNLGPCPNIGQPRQPLNLRHGSKWRSEDVLNKHSTADPIPQEVLTKLRGQVRAWDKGGSQLWRLGCQRGGRKCADSVCRKKGTAWKDGDSHQACGNCSEAWRLCVVVDRGTIEVLPLHKDQDTLRRGLLASTKVYIMD
ncbi:MAG: hypothetical protein Q9161_004338 [Pseudevernia consocians]